jgi:hypothetical protein
LKNESVLVETKMTREGLSDGKLGDELTIDIAHYKRMAHCKALVCFVYDPGHLLKTVPSSKATYPRPQMGSKFVCSFGQSLSRNSRQKLPFVVLSRCSNNFDDLQP